MARLNSLSAVEKMCPVFTKNPNEPVRCRGEECAWWSAISDPRIIAKGRMIVGCCFAVENLLWRVQNW